MKQKLLDFDQQSRTVHNVELGMFSMPPAAERILLLERAVSECRSHVADERPMVNFRQIVVILVWEPRLEFKTL